MGLGGQNLQFEGTPCLVLKSVVSYYSDMTKFNGNLFVVFFFILTTSSHSWAETKCEVVANQAAAVYAFCPPDAAPEKMADAVALWRDKYFNKKLNQIHIYFFNNKNKTPKTGNAFFKMSDADVGKYQTGIYDLNKNTGHTSFLCRKPNNKKMDKCESFIK